MKRLMVAVSMMVVACGVEATDQAEPQVSAQRAAVTTVPPLPAMPSLLPVAWYLRMHDARVLPAGLSSAYVVTILDPNDHTAFYAVGFDVAANRALFYLHGTMAGDYAPFNTDLIRDFSVIATVSPVASLDWGVQSQAHVGPVPGPQPGIPDLAWSIVNTARNATLPALQLAPKL